MVEALKESPADRDEGAGTTRVQILPLVTCGCEWTLTSVFLTLVLALGDEKEEGKEPNTDAFVDINGIYHSLPQLHKYAYVLSFHHLGQRSGARGLWSGAARITGVHVMRGLGFHCLSPSPCSTTYDFYNLATLRLATNSVS